MKHKAKHIAGVLKLGSIKMKHKAKLIAGVLKLKTKAKYKQECLNSQEVY